MLVISYCFDRRSRRVLGPMSNGLVMTLVLLLLIAVAVSGVLAAYA